MAQSIYDRIRELRKARRWTQERLARETGLTVTTISRLERGRHMPEDRTVRDLARALEAPELMEMDQLEGFYVGKDKE